MIMGIPACEYRYDTVTGRKTGFMARSVIGGHWMPVLAEKLGK